MCLLYKACSSFPAWTSSQILCTMSYWGIYSRISNALFRIMDALSEVDCLGSCEASQFQDFAKWISSWSTHHPKWRYVFWTDSSTRELIVKALPDFLETYDKLDLGVAKADFGRYAFMYVFGGVYVDLDFESIAPLTPLTFEHDAFTSVEPIIHRYIFNNGGDSMCNAVMGSMPRHPFWLLLMEEIGRRVDSNNCGDVVGCTGPRMMQDVFDAELTKSVLKRKGLSLSVLEPHLFYPEIAKWAVPDMKKRCAAANDDQSNLAIGCDMLKTWKYGENRKPDTLAEHHWQCSWCQSHEFEHAHINTIVPAQHLEIAFEDSIEFGISPGHFPSDITDAL